jgi:hypothetical protein
LCLAVHECLRYFCPPSLHILTRYRAERRLYAYHIVDVCRGARSSEASAVSARKLSPMSMLIVHCHYDSAERGQCMQVPGLLPIVPIITMGTSIKLHRREFLSTPVAAEGPVLVICGHGPQQGSPPFLTTTLAIHLKS